ncbi:hypothetical protein [uncultured Vibrio sp.]|uniref:hypothetical protein n=1 Tax=uncultured Vibrio sp. TaxID=114054 RepID=UPI0026031A24|nr:hypothetical protein [uncultured Vibrio sp.]
MPRKAIQQHTKVVNKLLNQPGVLHPTKRQYCWVNEQDSLDELWLICSSFIADINTVLLNSSSPHRFKKLEAQINYGGVFYDGQPQHSIQFNKGIVNDDWFIQLREAISALYVHVSPFHAEHHLLFFQPLNLQPNSTVLERLINDTKTQLQVPDFSLQLKPYVESYDRLISEHGAWVASISLMISLERCRSNLKQKPCSSPLNLSDDVLIKHVKKTQETLKQLYVLTSPFSVLDGRITTDSELRRNQGYQV